LFEAVGAGVEMTVAPVVAGGELHPFTVTVTLYVPDASGVALETVGLCKPEVNAFGPVHR
jgi:hypothetical protein